MFRKSGFNYAYMGLGLGKSILKGHKQWLKSVMELNNEILLTGSDDTTIQLWEKGALLQPRKNIQMQWELFVKLIQHFSHLVVLIKLLKYGKLVLGNVFKPYMDMKILLFV